MYLKYIEPFEGTEENLKKCIVLDILDLAKNYPENFECDISAIPTPGIETPTFIAKVLPLHAAFEKIKENSAYWNNLQTLRAICRITACLRWGAEIEVRLIALMSHVFNSQLLGIRYYVATDMIEQDLNEDLNYDPGLVSECLFNPWDANDRGQMPTSVMAAEEEVARVSLHPEFAGQFEDIVSRYEDKIEAHISKALPKVLYEVMTRLMMESMVASTDAFEPRFGVSDGDEKVIAKEVLEDIAKSARRFTHARLGIKRGGSRTTDKFVWTPDRKTEFYETVNKMVHTNGLPLWEFAHKELVEKDFSFRIIDWLRTETDLKDVPAHLWNNAIAAWKGKENDFFRLAADKKPDAFAMYHAIELLGFPKPAFSTMKKYFGHGKSLSIASNIT